MKGFVLASAAVTASCRKVGHKKITENRKVTARRGMKVSHSGVKKNVGSTPAPHSYVLELKVPSNPKSLSKRKLGYKVLEIYRALTISEHDDCHLTEAQKNELLKWYVALRRVYIERFCTRGRAVDRARAVSVLNLLIDEHGNIIEDKVEPIATNAKTCSVNASKIAEKANTKPVSVVGNYSTDADKVGDRLDQVSKEHICGKVVKSINRGGGIRSH